VSSFEYKIGFPDEALTKIRGKFRKIYNFKQKILEGLETKETMKIS
jgi:hypothetical protein